MKKVSELDCLELDYWVARAKNFNGFIENYSGEPWRVWIKQGSQREIYNPSCDWSQGGPIIERKRIEINFNAQQKTWSARLSEGNRFFKGNKFTGETLLVAAMRCFVASRYGDKVDDSQAHNL